MNNLKPTLGIEPIDKYGKAKNDLIQAQKSFLELTEWEQQMLAKEFLGAANVAAWQNIFRQAFGRQR